MHSSRDQIDITARMELPTLRHLKTTAGNSDSVTPMNRKRQAQIRSQKGRATPQLRNIARLLVAFETSADKSPGCAPHGSIHFSERLRPYLVSLYGTAGYRSLLSHALVRADAEVPWLRSMHMKADGSLEGLESLHVKLRPAEITEGKIVLLAQLLGSLVSYIGQRLTSRLLGEVWPQILRGEMTFVDGGEKNEKTD
jgi:hypothetical protein